MLLLEEAREERGVRARTPGGNIGGSAEGVVMAEGAVSGTSELWENKQMKTVSQPQTNCLQCVQGSCASILDVGHITVHITMLVHSHSLRKSIRSYYKGQILFPKGDLPLYTQRQVLIFSWHLYVPTR